MKGPEGVVVKDRKYHLKMYKNCFVGKEAVSWLLENAKLFGLKVKIREDAVKLGNRLMSMGIIFGPINHSSSKSVLEDENDYFTFEKESSNNGTSPLHLSANSIQSSLYSSAPYSPYAERERSYVSNHIGK
jgi:hypothetical protein